MEITISNILAKVMQEFPKFTLLEIVRAWERLNQNVKKLCYQKIIFNRLLIKLAVPLAVSVAQKAVLI